MAGRYKATRNDDGTWNVLGVPVFASNRLRKVEVTKDWQERAVRKAAAQYATNGYVPPLHENHHGGTDPVRRLGKWLPKRVVKVKTVETDEAGEPVVRDSWATEADLLEIPDAEYQRIKRGELPYVSVEAKLAEEEFQSLAMLPTQAPAIKLPPVTIGAEECHVTSYAATLTGARTTMRFSAVMDDSNKPDEAAAAPAATETVKPPEAPVAQAKAADGEEKPATPGVPPKPVPAQVEQAEVVPSWAASILSTMKALGDMIGKIGSVKAESPVPLSATSGYSATPATTTTTSAGTDTTVSVTVAPASTTSAAPTAEAEKFAALAGEVAVLREAEKQRKAEDEMREKVRPLAKRVLARVPSFDPDEMFAMAKSHGVAYAEAYTAAVERYGVAAPPPSLSAALTGGPTVPAEVDAYKDKAPEVFAAAKTASDIYDAQPYMRGGQTRARWIDNYLTANGIK